MEIRNLTKRFGSFTAVDNISFHVRKGEIFGFLGANGAGKTTAMRILCGLSRPTEGEGTVAGFDINREQEKIKKHIGYMSQKFSLYPDLTVKENIRLFGGIYGLGDRKIKEKTVEMLDMLDMKDVRDTLAGCLPLGWKQKLSFSIALVHEPQIIFLDEPTGVIGFEKKAGALSGGIMTTGNYPGRARTPEELRADMDEVFRIVAGRAKREE